MRTVALALVLLVAATATAQSRNEEANRLLAQSIPLIGSKPAEALRLLQQAARLDPERGEIRYRLGLAFHAIGDEADAEPELREAAARLPDSAAIHNDLGIVLFQQGNAKAALEEFRIATKLAPADPNAHFNLGESYARTGENQDALEQIRIAAGLTPNDNNLARLVKTAEASLQPAEGAIKVDVRQVLVPVVVLDKEGHHVPGLTQKDFKVFEDGVEQKITAFSVESSGTPDIEASSKTTPMPARQPPAPAPQSIVARPAARRTYLIVIDTLHTSFNNFVAARKALVKLFREERPGDSQYVMVSIGASSEMILNVTSDPAAVLAVVESPKFQKYFVGGNHSLQPEVDRFRRDLADTRDACDTYAKTGEKILQDKCSTGKTRAPLAAQEIAEFDRTLTVGFLRQFRALVAQLARARDRRTIVLVSDGFQIVPGRQVYDLMSAYFPDIRGHSLQAVERLQSEFEPILRLAAGNNITIDTIDSRGLYGQAGFDASHSADSLTVDGAVGRAERNSATSDGNTLREIADATGGTAFHDNNNLFAGLQRAFADGRDYYNIAYVSGNANADGKFRSITVQILNRNLTVNAKRGYWAEPVAR